MRIIHLLVTGLLLASLSPSHAGEWITLPGRDGVALQAWITRPAGAGPHPAIVAMHGCGGMGGSGKRINDRHADWAERLSKAGFVVVFPDSFRSRGLGSQCNVRERTFRSKDRAEDAFATLEWLTARPEINARKIGLLGWSNGGGAVLSAARDIRAPKGGVDFKQAVAFYPGCRAYLDGRYATRMPVTILHGLADDWTPAEPCQKLKSVTFIGYPDAHHDFDFPNLPIRTRKAAFSANGTGIVTAGTHPEAREKAIATAMALFRGM